jgi:uncharacterized membrane protein YtjA (UPF0391 family)
LVFGAAGQPGRAAGLSKIIWFVWLGIILLRNNPSRAA